VKVRLIRLGACGLAALTVLVALPLLTSAATPKLTPCSLSGIGHIQICPVTFKIKASKSARVTVARYSDFSRCNLPAPGGEPGQNSNYVVASVTINWGDGTRATSGVAHTGKKCPGSDALTPGANEPVTGRHRYARPGTYQVSVSLTYVRGKTNTFQNCAKATHGSTSYSNLTNCIALNAPVTSIGVVGAKR
jgi:hypothetical protein